MAPLAIIACSVDIDARFRTGRLRMNPIAEKCDMVVIRSAYGALAIPVRGMLLFVDETIIIIIKVLTRVVITCVAMICIIYPIHCQCLPTTGTRSPLRPDGGGGQQHKDHDQNQQDGKNLFHICFSLLLSIGTQKNAPCPQWDKARPKPETGPKQGKVILSV